MEEARKISIGLAEPPHLAIGNREEVRGGIECTEIARRVPEDKPEGRSGKQWKAAPQHPRIRPAPARASPDRRLSPKTQPSRAPDASMGSRTSRPGEPPPVSFRTRQKRRPTPHVPSAATGRFVRVAHRLVQHLVRYLISTWCNVCTTLSKPLERALLQKGIRSSQH